ncbi:MAG: DUF3502 domain-containing protein [Christensenellales bacterium]|jgi:putative aldouronate transport system substrate-binding protein
MKRFLALLIVAVLALGVSAFAGEISVENAPDVWAETWADVDTSNHVVVNYMTTGDAPTTGANAEMLAELNKILTEKINAEINIVWISWTDYLANYNLRIAAMDGSIDLIGSSTDWLDAWPNAKRGGFCELSPELLAKYAPVTWATIPQEHWDVCTYEGNIYFIPENNYSQWTNHGFAYRLDWAHEAGLENGCQTWEDLTAYVKYVKEAYGDTLIALWDTDGTAYPAGGYITSFVKWRSIDGLASGAIWGGYLDDPYTINCLYLEETDRLVEYARLMKEWDELGVWPTDVLSNTGVDNRLEFRQGKTALEQHHTQTWTGLVSPKANKDNTMYIDDEDADVGFYYWGKEAGYVTRDLVTHGVAAISNASPNVERTLMVYDMLRNDRDCYDLFNYGLKDRTYALDENGYRYTPDSYVAEVDGISTNWWWGRNDALEIPSAQLNWDAINALYEEYDKIAVMYPYEAFVFDNSMVQSYINQCNETYNTYMKYICFGQYDGTPEDIVAEFQSALRAAGADEVTAELQVQIDALYK